MLRAADDPLSLTPVLRDFVADALTPITAYLALATPGRSCLLESVEGTDRISRYSFIGLDYLETAVFEGDSRMLDGIREIARRYEIDRTLPLPFPGGLVCVFAYDAARVLEKIGPRPPSDVHFADAYVAVPGTWLIFDHFTHRVTLLGFAGRETPDEVGRRLDRHIAKLLSSRPTIPAAIRARGPVSASFDEPTFLARVAEAKHAIHEGDAYQLQLSIRFSAEFDGTPFDFYRQVRTRNPSPYMFYIENEDGAVFGASPEFLVRLDGRDARLRPLAGTRSRGATEEEDLRIERELLSNEKECAEHVMLVDLGRNDLGAVCRIGSVHVDELMVIERYSHVMHIVSSCSGTLRDDKDALDLFAAAYPAGTVTGTPKIRAMQIIDSLEPVARGFYAGSIAHLDFDGDLDSCITLRSVHVKDGRAYWQAAAGIVADSEPAAEYEEIFHKTRIIREVLGL